MSDFIPIIFPNELNSNINLQNLGKATGFLGFGRKIYLVYDEQKGSWGIKSLNLPQRILRFVFGSYRETHKEVVKTRLLSNLHPFEQEARQNSAFAERVHHIWNIRLSQSSNDPISPAKQLMIEYRKALGAADLKNIQRVCLFGDWKEMGFNIDMPSVKAGHEFTLLEQIATELPELGHYAFINIRGNGECGYRAIVTGLIHNDCILQNNIEGLKCSFQNAFDSLITAWDALPFDETQRGVFEASKTEALTQLDRMQEMSIQQRMALLQEEKPFLAPFLSLVRCITVSQTKIIQDQDIEQQVTDNLDRTNEILATLREKANLTEEEEKDLSYAVKNYPLNLLLSRTELIDIPRNPLQNSMKSQLQSLAERANGVDGKLLIELEQLVNEGHTLSNKQNILAAPLGEMLEMGLTMEEFLKQKALSNADSARYLWALGSDFTAIGYALNKNICCIYRDEYKKDEFGIQKTFSNRPVDFYGLNMTGQVHYNALLPLLHAVLIS